MATAPAYPYKNSFDPLIEPGTYGNKQVPVAKPNTEPVAGFNPLRYWGNLSPWYSTSFGLDTASPIVPDQCALTQVHFVSSRHTLSSLLMYYSINHQLPEISRTIRMCTFLFQRFYRSIATELATQRPVPPQPSSLPSCMP